MLCRSCGTENGEQNAFCVKCGTALNAEQKSEKTVTATVSVQNKKGFDIGKMFRILGKGLIKPLETIEENKNEYRIPAKGFTLAGIVTAISMLLYFFSRILQTVFIKGMKPSFDYLEGFHYFKILGIGILLAAGFILVVASVYYLASLVAKKESNYGELIFIGTVAVLPLIVVITVLAPILSYIWLPLKTAITIIAFVYSMLIVVIPISKTMTFVKEDQKVYFHLICLGIICVASYFVYDHLIDVTMMKQIADTMTDIFDSLF